ncbi:cochlin isoform X2 [Syngnathus acus]|uniref:cochlin isoform X2 n=1 Tax=Syngnathus acus TaxID=161584 RepID=UPI001885B381|nr:cochlin isoform X2 [Syngnathus acus]
MSALLFSGVLFLVSWRSCESSARALTCGTRAADLDPTAMVGGIPLRCPPHCAQRRLSVFGTTVYAAVSSICGAALHSSAVGHTGGEVLLSRLPGQQHYVGTLANGVQSQALSRWSASFTLQGLQDQRPQELIRDSGTNSRPAKKAAKKMSVKKVGNKDCQMDIGLVIDSSSNLGQRRFNLQKNFVAKLVAMLKVGVDGPHVGLVQASDLPRTEFLLSNYTQPKELQFAIKALAHLGGNTNTAACLCGTPAGKAITHTAEMLFTQRSGARRGRPRVMLVLIDGWPSDELQPAATAARHAGINVFLATVTQPTADELPTVPDRDFAKKAVCKDNGFFSYQMSSWFGTTKHVKPLAQRLCSPDGLLCSMRFDGRTCYNSVNVGFLIDGSSSVGDPNFRTLLDFLAAIATKFDISDMGARVGAVQFTYDQRLEFGLREHDSKDGVLGALRAIPYMSGGTATGSAITFAAQNLFRPTAVGRNFLIVVTDGQSYDSVDGPALAAQNQGISMFSVGVAWAPMDDLRAMASEPKDEHVFFSQHFDGLEELVDNVVRVICHDFDVNN